MKGDGRLIPPAAWGLALGLLAAASAAASPLDVDATRADVPPAVSSRALDAEVSTVWDFDISGQDFLTDDHPWKKWYRRTYGDDHPLGYGFSDVLLEAAWSTNLPSKPDEYPQGISIHLISPEVNIPKVGVTVLELWHHYDTQLGGAGGRVFFDIDGVIIPLVPFGGYPGSVAVDGAPAGAFTGHENRWVKSFFDLSPVKAWATSDARGSVVLEFQSNSVSDGLGWHIERLTLWEGDAIPPVILPLTTPSDTDRYDLAYEFAFEILENDALLSADIIWSSDGPLGEQSALATMIEGDDGIWRGSIPPQPPGSVVSWSVVAEDVGGNLGIHPPEGQAAASFRVDVAAPTQLRLRDAARIATELTLEWDRPVGSLNPERYYLYHASSPEELADPGPDLRVTEVVGALSVTLPLTDEGLGPYFSVSAVFAAAAGSGPWEGPLSTPLRADGLAPSLGGISPAVGYQGQEVPVEIVGEISDFAQGDVAIIAGEGITVDQVDVVDVRLIRATLQIDPRAEVGPRVFTVTVGGDWRGEVDFDVLSAGERPSITSLSPRAAMQGEALDVKFVGQNTDFNIESLRVDFGAGVLVSDGITVDADGQGVTVPIRVETWCDVGVRSVLVSAGDVVFADIPFEVRPGSVGFNDGCDTTGGGEASWAFAIGLLLLLGYRRRVGG